MPQESDSPDHGPKPGTVALTGARGFAGSALCPVLEADGWQVRALGRAEGLELSMATADDWARALEGADAAVHMASALPWDGDNGKSAALPRFLAANTEASARLMRGLVRAGGRHLVYLSSIGVNGITTPMAPFRADDAPNPVGNYAISKARAEDALNTIAAETGVALTILRPPILYGAGVSGSFGKLVDRIGRGGLLPLGGIDNARDMMGVRNLADLIAALLARPATGTYLTRDRDTVSTTALVTMIAGALDRPVRLITIPRPLRRLARALPVAGPLAERLFGDVRIDDSPLTADCLWTPRYTVADEIAALARQRLAAG